jgi:hypothetical protein
MHPLEALSNAVHPDHVTDPTARAALVRVTARLRPLLHGPWPEPHQLVALAYCELARDRCLIADDPGLGKTIIGITRIVLGAHRMTVIIAPTNVFSEWGDQIRKWLPRMPIHTVTSGAAPLPPAGWCGVILITWGLLIPHCDGLMRIAPSLVIADEAHYGNNPGTPDKPVQRTAALADLVAAVPHAILLTGTPFANKSVELWWLLHMLDPRAWPDEEPFKAIDKQYSQRDDEGHEVTVFDPSGASLDGDGVARPSTFQRRIRQYMCRRLKGSALPGLKAKVYKTVPVVMTADEQRYYQFVEQQFRAWLRNTVGRELIEQGYVVGTPEFHAEILARTEGTLRAEYLAKQGKLRKIVGRIKIPHAVHWIVGMVRSGEPVVVFVEFRDVLGEIAAGLRAFNVKHAIIAGGVNAKERKVHKDAFMSGKIDVVLCSSAGREGLTLTRARFLLHVEQGWTSSSEDQKSDRVHRMTQLRAVQIHRMVVLGTIDVRMSKINNRKRGLIEGTIGAAPVVSGDGPAPRVITVKENTLPATREPLPPVQVARNRPPA